MSAVKCNHFLQHFPRPLVKFLDLYPTLPILWLSKIPPLSCNARVPSWPGQWGRKSRKVNAQKSICTQKSDSLQSSLTEVNQRLQHVRQLAITQQELQCWRCAITQLVFLLHVPCCLLHFLANFVHFLVFNLTTFTMATPDCLHAQQKRHRIWPYKVIQHTQG